MSAPAVRRSLSVRQPLAGLALAAVAGILLADGARRLLLSAAWEDSLLPWIADASFLTLAAVFVARPRAWTFWAAAVAGFAAMHFFHADPVPAAALARTLALPDSTGRASHIVRVTGRVDDPPRRLPDSLPSATHEPPLSASWRFVLTLENLAVDGQTSLSHAQVSVTWRDGPHILAEGDRLELTGLANNLRGPRNSGEFDNAALQQRRGIYSEILVTGMADGRVTGSDGRGWLSTLAARVHDAMEGTLRTDLRDDPEAGAVVATMLLGLRDDPGLGDLQGMFQRTGTLHYFAIDGLKLGLVGAVLLQVLAAAGLSRGVASLLVLPVLVLYALATGLGPASGRALLVAAALLGGHWLDRPARPVNHLGAAALILLCCDTNELFAIGFQLTFLVVLSILLFAPGIARRLARYGAPDPFLPVPLFSRTRRAWEWVRRQLCGLLAVALAAWIGSLPVMALDFGIVSPISPVANVVAFPLAFLVVALGTLSLGGAWVAHWWVACINNTNWLAAHALLAVVRAFDAVPGGSVAVPDPSTWRWWHPPLAEITVLDLGRARAAYLHARNGADWLIDTGRPAAYARSVRPTLRAYGVTRFGSKGGLILTRVDADHVSAAPLALNELSPRRVVDSLLAGKTLHLRDFRRSLDPARQGETRVGRGSVIDLAPGIEARVLYPPNDPPPPAPVTAASRALVLQVCIADGRGAEWRALLLPDGADGRAALWLMANETPEALQSAVLVTDAPVTAEFVRAVGARLVVVRSGQEEEDAPAKTAALPTLPGVDFIVQQDSGAVNLRFYPGAVEARGFVNGRKIVLTR